MSIKAQIDGKKFDIRDVATMEMFIAQDRARLRALSGTIEMYSNDPDMKSGLQKEQLELRERIRISESLLTLAKG